MGKTDEEKEQERITVQFDAIDRELLELDARQSRSSAEITEAYINKCEPLKETIKYHLERQERIKQLRKERKNLVGKE